jgi:hypothetical protein
VVRALVALPRQIVWVVGAPTGRAPVDLLMALVANAAAVVLVFSFARAIYYPFWAAGASVDELERSWGGPGAVGATLVHWLVAAAVIVASYLVILLVERRTPERG